MPDFVKAVILGIVEGITEFLPISSTGHLIVVAEILEFPSTDGAFEIGIQLGAVMAVLWFYRRSLVEQARVLRRDTTVQRFWSGVALAFVPAGIVGYLLGDYITDYLFSPRVVAISLIVGGVALWAVELMPLKPRTSDHIQISLKQAIIIGISQLTALIPGVSRSGSTIVGGMLAGLDRRTATIFSFYLAIPTLGIATSYVLLRSLDVMSSVALGDVAIGLIASFFMASIAIKWLLRYVSRHDFRLLAAYRIMVGIVILVVL